MARYVVQWMAGRFLTVCDLENVWQWGMLSSIILGKRCMQQGV